LMPEMGMISY